MGLNGTSMTGVRLPWVPVTLNHCHNTSANIEEGSLHKALNLIFDNREINDWIAYIKGVEK